MIVGLNTDLDVHIARAIGLLQDESVLFIVIRTRKAQAVQRALSVLTAVTRYRHRECLPDLKQYVVEEAVPPPPGPKVIQLNAPKWVDVDLLIADPSRGRLHRTLRFICRQSTCQT